MVVLWREDKILSSECSLTVDDHVVSIT